ncbi:MAG: BrnT family toxin [Gemmatimonadales bacterium]
MGVLDEFFAGVEGFEWDEGNSDKNWRRHAVRQVEAEQTLLNRPRLLALDVKHSQQEPRFIALGQTDAQRRLAVVFTVRGPRVRVISARSMSPVERRIYGQAQAPPEADS